MALTSEGRILKMWMLGMMLAKLSKLYPKFADKCRWEDANLLLAEFCLPEEERNVVNTQDLYYISAIANELHIPFHEVFQGFQLADASQSEESQSQ